MAIAEVGNPPLFHPFEIFFQHLELEFASIRCDRMQAIQNFQKEKDDTPHIMYT